MEVLCRIRDLHRAILEFETQLEQQFGLNLNEGMLLCTLMHTGQVSSGEVANLLGLTCSNCSKVIASVEKKKLIQRKLGKNDKRQMYFVLTKQGQALYDAIQNTTSLHIPELLLQVVE